MHVISGLRLEHPLDPTLGPKYISAYATNVSNV